MIDEGAHLDAPNLLSGRAVMERAAAESVLDLARKSTGSDEQADFFERGAGRGELGVTIRTDTAEVRIAENA